MWRAPLNRKEESGRANVMVRGAANIRLHLMFGVIALFAAPLLKPAG